MGHAIAATASRRNRPPGGGVMLLEMLNILERFDLAGLGHNTPEYIRVVAEAMKRATIDKDRFVGDPAFTDVPLDRLIVARRTRPSSRSEIRARPEGRGAAPQRRRAGEGHDPASRSSTATATA